MSKRNPNKSIADRIGELLASKWASNQSAAARDLAISQPLLSLVLKGERTPGSHLIAQFVRFGVSEEWLRHGKGQPFQRTSSVLDVPIFRVLLPGNPDECPEIRHCGFRRFETTYPKGLYWYLVERDRITEAKHEGVLRGDFLLVDASPECKKAFNGNAVCVVKRPSSGELMLARVNLYDDGEERYLNADFFPRLERRRITKQKATPESRSAFFEEMPDGSLRRCSSMMAGPDTEIIRESDIVGLVQKLEREPV